MINIPFGSDYPQPTPKGWGLYIDPLYGYIPLSPILRRAINLPTFQRLRHIKQLSVLDLVFVGATHTRFEHSVGVCHLSALVWQAIQRRQQEQPRSNNVVVQINQALALSLAGLFHDVGHGPYSHSFEEFQKRHRRFNDVTHEAMTDKLIRTGELPYNDIPAFLNALVNQKKATTNAGADAEWLSPENIAAIATGNPPPKNKTCVFLSEIIAGDFGVDRLDYLRRDAFHTGLSTGAVDIWEIVHGYEVLHDTEKKVDVVRLRSSVALAMEALITARDLIFRKAYYAPAHRVAEEMLISALHAIEPSVSPDDLALLTDDELVHEILKRDNSLAKELIRRDQFRMLYETLPLHINVQTYLDEIAQKRLKSLFIHMMGGGYGAVWDLAERLSQQLGFAPSKTIIFDLRPPAITKEAAYTKDYFFDNDSGLSNSLMKLLPHLGLTHDKGIINGGEENLHALYERTVWTLLISVPYDWIQSCVKTAIQNRGFTRTASPADLNEAAEVIYHEYGFETIIRGLEDLLSLRDFDRRNKLEAAFQATTVYYLRDLLLEQVINV